MQKNPAKASKTKIEIYNPSSPSKPIAYLINRAPAYKSAYLKHSVLISQFSATYRPWQPNRKYTMWKLGL